MRVTGGCRIRVHVLRAYNIAALRWLRVKACASWRIDAQQVCAVRNGRPQPRRGAAATTASCSGRLAAQCHTPGWMTRCSTAGRDGRVTNGNESPLCQRLTRMESTCQRAVTVPRVTCKRAVFARCVRLAALSISKHRTHGGPIAGDAVTAVAGPCHGVEGRGCCATAKFRRVYSFFMTMY